MDTALHKIANTVFPGHSTGQQPVAATLLIGTPERKFLSMRRALGDYIGSWGIPGGGVDAGETPAQAALREAREEAQFTATSSAKPFMRYTAHGGKHAGTLVLVFLTVVAQPPSIILNCEHDDFTWTGLNSWPQPATPMMQFLSAYRRAELESYVTDPGAFSS